MKKQKSKIGFLVLGALAAFAMFALGNVELGLSLAMVAPVVIAAGKTSLELKHERKSVNDSIDAIAQKRSTENRDYTPEELSELSKLQLRYDQLTKEIEVAEHAEKRAAINAAASFGSGASNSEEKEMRSFSFGKLISHKLNNTPIDGIERELIDESTKEARSMGLKVEGSYLSQKVLDNMVQHRAMSAGAPTGGGNTIQTDKVGFFDALYAKRVLAQLGVKYMTGLSNNVDLTGLGTGVTSAWGTETAELADGSPTTAYRPLTPHRLGSYIPMSNQLLIQNPQLEGFVMQSLMESIYVAVEAAYINGTGLLGQPTGLLGTQNIQDVAMGTNGSAPSLPKILELVGKLGQANANTENLKFLINPKTEAKLKQTAIVNGTGAMIMSYQNYFTGTPNVIDGKITAVTSNVPSNLTKGDSSGICSALICGEFNRSVIGQFGGMDIIIDPYTLARTGQTRVVANTYWDMAFERPEVFGAILDILA